MASTPTIFIRLLSADDKAAALFDITSAVKAGESNVGLFAVEAASLRHVPGSPFAYWVHDEVRTIYSRFPKLESGGRAVQFGASTKSDARFLRTWWEISPAVSGRNRTDSNAGRRWVPLSKGGAYSRFYSDWELVVDWLNDGAELKSDIANYRGSRGWGYNWTASLNGHTFYFRPGLTWPRRTIAGLSVRALPTGGIFGDKGPSLFTATDAAEDLACLLGLMNSAPFRELLALQVPSSSFEVGLLEVMPVPDMGLKDRQVLRTLADEALRRKRDSDRGDEVTHPFTIPALARLRAHATLAEAGESLAKEDAVLQSRLAEIQHEIDDRAYDLYGFTAADRARAEASVVPPSDDDRAAVSTDDKSALPDERCPNLQLACPDLIMYAIGCTFGRWDVRIGRDPTLAPKLAGPFAPLPVCAPGALVGPDALPATPGRIVSEEWLRARPDAITLPPEGAVRRPTIPDDAYPIRIAWDGILVDDPDHPADIVRRVRAVLGVLWPGENGASAEAIEREACQILGIAELRDYFRRPASFFADHLKRYSKSRRQAPIYWPLSTASGAYTLWIYYHRLTSDTLYTAVNRYVEPKIAAVERRLADDERALASAAGREASRLRDAVQAARDFLTELRNFRDELLRVAALPYRPDLNDGVIITAAPLHRLFHLPRWAKDTKACWEKLARGDYDWAHLALTLWPDRVRAKCATDKSLAIAHDLEDLYVEPPIAAKKARGRKAAAHPQAELAEAEDAQAQEEAEDDEIDE